jgi:transcriptional regulator with XRE-family HTH domain
MIEAAQIRAARALLDLSQAELSDLSSISATTIKRLEAAPQLSGTAETLWKIQRALEAAGVEFIPADEAKGPGVRLKDNAAKESKRPERRGKQGLKT